MNDIEEQLATGMREYASQVHLSTDVVAQAARRNRRRGVALRSGALTATLGVAVAVVLAVTTHSPPAAHNADPTSTAPAMSNVAQLVRTALDDNANLILHTVVHVPGWGESVAWTDASAGGMHVIAYGTDGSVQLEYSTLTADGQVTMLVVDPDQHTYMYSRTRGGVAVGKITDIVSAQAIQDQLADGELTVVGTEELNGQSALHLQLSSSSQLWGANLWVNSTTYVALRLSYSKPDPGAPTVTEDFQWLDRTPANIALATLTPPAGYTQTYPHAEPSVTATGGVG